MAWSFGPLAVEGEPVVWRDRVVLTGRDPTGRRALTLLDLASGRLLSRTLFAASEPLAVALWNERIAVRVAATRVEVYRLKNGRLQAERSFAHPSSLSPPVLVEDELYLREGDELVRYDLSRREATWRVPAEGAFRGTPALRGARVHALRYDAEGAAHLALLDRATGAALDEVLLGRSADGDVPGAHEPGEIVVHEGSVFLHLPRPLPSTEGIEYPWARVFRADERLRPGATLHAFLAAPLETPAGWIAPELVERDGEGATRWILVRREGERERAIELAAQDHHAWLTPASAAGSRAGELVYLGPAAVDLTDLELCWRREDVPALRPVPVDGGLLVVEGDMVRCLTSAPRPRTPAEERASATARDLDRAHAERLAALAPKATRSGDLALAEGLLAEAEDLGAEGRSVTIYRGEIERLQAGSRPPPLDPRRRTAVLEEEAALRARWPAELARAARLGADPAFARALLRELFRRVPADPSGLALLGGLLPGSLEPSPEQASSWLDFLDVDARLPLELREPAAEAPRRSRAEAQLIEERASWRPEALGYASPRLFVIAAGAAPGAVARVLEAGELVCSVLESTFVAGTLATAEPLVLVLYPTREEYLAESGSDLGGLETVLGWTAGHYDPSAGVSRMFLPADDRENRRLLGVYAHELTHHWLASRSSFGPARGAPATPGYWVAEAIASWAEELVLDPQRGTWSADNPRAASLDSVANVDPSALLPWQRLLALSFDDYRRLETRPTTTATLTWQLGMRADRSPMQLFYAQGGALAHYLFRADGGRHRTVLTEAVAAFYRGTPLDVARTLGLSPEDLGERVRLFAREAVGS